VTCILRNVKTIGEAYCDKVTDSTQAKYIVILQVDVWLSC